jgi:hypothetical protein
MSKASVTRLFIASLVAVAAGAILAIAAVWLAIANDVFATSGSEVVGIRGSVLAWCLLGIGVVGGSAIAGGMIGGLLAWIGALLNTWQVEGRSWFVILLLTGIFNFGFIAMVAYVLAGPDGTSAAARLRGTAPAGAS